ncbi:hypothetical protein HY546_02015 [archaeon]|nr:hypothetical protein [archaeon]
MPYCSKCKKDIDQKILEYSQGKFAKILCIDCQKMAQTQYTRPTNTKSDGLTKGQSRFADNMIKGRIAETLIEELFLASDYNVFRYGMENTVPGIMKLLKGVNSEAAWNIRKMPDFVVQKGKKVFFVEVKFRANETFGLRDLKEDYGDYPYENAYFIVVSKKHIKCITYEELKNRDEIAPSSNNYLGNRREFEFDKRTIIDFCDFAVKYFEAV